MYSAHDDTVSLILGSLGLNDGYWPSYSAHIVFELWQDGTKRTAGAPAENSGAGSYYVRVIYNGQPGTLALAGCKDPFCPWPLFWNFVRQSVILNRDNYPLCFT